MASNPMFYIDSATSDEENEANDHHRARNRRRSSEEEVDETFDNSVRNVETPMKDCLKVEVVNKADFEESLTSYKRKTSKYLTRQVGGYVNCLHIQINLCTVKVWEFLGK